MIWVQHCKKWNKLILKLISLTIIISACIRSVLPVVHYSIPTVTHQSFNTHINEGTENVFFSKILLLGKSWPAKHDSLKCQLQCKLILYTAFTLGRDVYIMINCIELTYRYDICSIVIRIQVAINDITDKANLSRSEYDTRTNLPVGQRAHYVPFKR